MLYGEDVALKVRFYAEPHSWDRVQFALRDGSKNIRDLAKVRYLIGPNVPYATHWIEEGWRDDPRFGVIHVTYRNPAATNFMKNTVRKFRKQGAQLRRRRPSENLFGAGFFAVPFMLNYAEDVVESMEDILDKHIYRRGEAGFNPLDNSHWTRTWALMRSIDVRRV